MANIRQATLTLRVDSTQAQRDTKGLTGALDILGLSSKRTTSMMASLKREILGLVSAYAGFRVIRQSIKDFADFEKQMAMVNTMLYMGNSQYLPQYTKQIQALSIAMGENTATLAKGLYDVLSAAIPASEAMKLLETTSKAAVGGMTTTATATDAVISVLKSYGLGTEYAAKVSSDLFEVVQRGEITFEELANNIGHVAPIAAQAGVSLEELLAFIATTTRAGLRAELAVTAVKNAISEFIKPSREGAALAKELGFSLESATLKSVGLRGVFDLLKDQSPEVLATLFADIRGVNAVMATLGQFDQFLFDFGYITKTASAHLDAFGKIADTTAMKYERFWQAMAHLRRSLGEVLAPTIVEVTDKITKFVQDNPEKFRQYGELLSIEIGRWKDIFMAFAEYLKNDFSGAAGVAMDIFVAVLELAGKQAVDLALRTGQGIWQAVKAGVLGDGPDQADIEARAKQLYWEHGGRGKARNSRDIKSLMATEVDAVTGDRDIVDQLLAPWTMKQATMEAQRQLREEQARAKRDEIWGGVSPSLQADFQEAATRIKAAAGGSLPGTSLGSDIGGINATRDAQRKVILDQIAQKKRGAMQQKVANVAMAPGNWLLALKEYGENWDREHKETFGNTLGGTMTEDEIRQMQERRKFNREVGQYVETLQGERKALAMTKEEAQKYIEVLRLKQQAREKNIELSELYEIQVNKEIDALQKAQKLARIGDEIGSGFARGFADATMHSRNLTDALHALENAAIGVMERILEIMLWEPMAQGISANFMRWMNPGPVTTPAASQSPFTQAAHGRLFRGSRVLPFAAGGIINQPTMFPLSSGMGLAGESGPEWAIAPLKRMPSGNLGVETSGTGSVKAEIHLHNESGVPLEGEVSNIHFDGKRLMVGMMLKDKRNNGPIHRANRRR